MHKMYKIITISREFGSGGRTVGRSIAKRLQIPCYDRELIEKAAEESGLAKDYIAQEGEYAPSKSLFSYAFLGRNSKGESISDYIWKVQRQIILELAEKGPYVIVGRCADYILKDREDALHVFLHADTTFKANRVIEKYGETDIGIEQRLHDKDHRRALNYRYYTDQIWGDAEHYDLTLNTSHIGIENCVDILVELAGKER